VKENEDEELKRKITIRNIGNKEKLLDLLAFMMR
jgi:hypothetical protein